MITLENITKTYELAGQPIKVFENTSLKIGSGEFLIINGPSGAGKTTLLNLIGGMTKCDSGKIIVNGSIISEFGNSQMACFRNKNIGFIFQFQSMVSTLNMVENILLPFVFSKTKPDKSKIHDVIHMIGLEGKERAYAHQLSMGQQRRVAVAREMVRDTKLLLCDEPTGDLDPDSENLVMHLIAERHKKGTTIIMATHNHALKNYATKTFTLSNGMISE